MSNNSVRSVLQKAEKDIQQRGFLITKLDEITGWARSNSLWPMTFGLALKKYDFNECTLN